MVAIYGLVNNALTP